MTDSNTIMCECKSNEDYPTYHGKVEVLVSGKRGVDSTERAYPEAGLTHKVYN